MYLFLDLLDTLRLDFVHQSAEDHSILENISKVTLGKLLIQHRLNPLNISKSMSQDHSAAEIDNTWRISFSCSGFLGAILGSGKNQRHVDMIL